MQLQHVNVKIFVEGDLKVDPEQFINVFHRWIRENELDELLIDVADYRHVPAGPGVMLIGHEADYSMDNNGGRWGLLYNCKAPSEEDNAEQVAAALRCAAGACERLEAEVDGLKFSRQTLEIIVNDRAIAPNTPETFAACQADLEAGLKAALGLDDFTLDQHDDPRRRFGVSVQAAQPLDLAASVA